MDASVPEQADILKIIQRCEEESSARDSIDNFEPQHAGRRWDASLYRPVVDHFLIEQFPSWPGEISWPDGKRFAACLTHDVDSVQLDSRSELIRGVRQQVTDAPRVSEKLKHLLSLTGLRRSPQKFDIFSPWLEIEEKFGFQSTFFVFPTRVRQRHIIDNVYRWDDRTTYRGERSSVRDILRNLQSRGWDIGLHGSYLSARSYEMIAEQKDDLENALGKPVMAIRQHNLHFDAAVTPALLERAGLKVDSTLGFNRDVGFRAGTSYPYPMWDPAADRWLSITEIPLMIHDGALLRPNNLDLNPEGAVALCKRLIDRVVETKGVITLLWHPESIVRPGWFDVYEKLLTYIHEKNGWGASAGQIYGWWTSQGFDKMLQRLLDTLAPGEMTKLPPSRQATAWQANHE